jgi:8-oxo-dGTP pyrophosphatase MutT (NUDIX family)
MKRRDVVTAFLRHDNRILLVRRSDQVGSYQGRWAGISGYLEDPTALDQAEREIREETGLSLAQITLRAAAEPLEVAAEELDTLWVVHPFLFDVDDPDAIELDWENRELRWVDPGDVAQHETVPALDAALQACLEAEQTHHD